jgi:hypothetical protein
MVPELCVTIGRQLNEFKRMKALRSRSIFRFEHIGANSSGKVGCGKVDVQQSDRNLSRFGFEHDKYIVNQENSWTEVFVAASKIGRKRQNILAMINPKAKA